MTETWFREAIHDATLAGGADPRLDGVLALGRRARRRRTLAGTGAGALAVLAVAGVGGAVVQFSGAGTAGHAVRTGTLSAGSPTPDSGVAAADALARSAAWWHVGLTASSIETVKGKKALVPEVSVENWYAHTGPSVVEASGGPASAAATWQAVSGGLTWDQMFTLPTDVAGLRSYYLARGGKAASLTAWAQGLLAGPGPVALHRGLVSLLVSQPGVTVSTGVDGSGRPAEVIDLPLVDGAATAISGGPAGSSGGTVGVGSPAPGQPVPAEISTGLHRVLVDERTGTLLETDVVHENSAYDQGDGRTGQVERRYLYTGVGPVESAPAVTAATARPRLAGPACTPKPLADPSDAAARVASVCLDNPAPGFALRRFPDNATRQAASFFLATQPSVETPDKNPANKGVLDGHNDGAEITFQMYPGHYFQLAGVSSTTPDASGRIGTNELAVGTTTALGVQATEITGDSSSSAGNGLLLEKDGIAMEIYGSAASATAPQVSFDQLVAVVDSLRGA